MPTLTKVLTKLNKRTWKATDIEKKLYLEYANEWKKQKQEIVLKTDFDYIRASVIFQSIKNKQKIENQYLKTRYDLNEFWNHLDYTERKRLVTIDLQDCYNKLPSFYDSKEGKQMYIAFFDERLNALYREETVIFELKQYKSLMDDYSTLIQKDLYKASDYFNGSFVPTLFVGKNDTSTCYYNFSLQTFYIEQNGNVEAYPLFDKKVREKTITKELLIPLGNHLLNEKQDEFLEMCLALGLYSDEFVKKVRREQLRKHIFSKG